MVDQQPSTELARISTTLRLTREYPATITALVVGNEVLLRGEMTTADLAATIRSVKAQVAVPVTYADVREFWLRNRELYDAVDFVTIHILPYWEDFPVRAKFAAAHVDAIRRRMAVAFPGKEILIGETGWPSTGRMREAALPSRSNQARVVSEILDLAKRENFRVNLMEAYDQPWKRQLEGTVGGYWGLFDSVRRALKYPPGIAVSNYPLWKFQMASGMVLAVLVFAVAWLTLRRRPWTPRLVSWVAVGVTATLAGVPAWNCCRQDVLRKLRPGRLAFVGFAAGGCDRLSPGQCQRADVRSFAANLSGIAGARELSTLLSPDAGPGANPGGRRLDRRRYCARPCVRPALQGFSLRFPDHGRRAVCRIDAA